MALWLSCVHYANLTESLSSFWVSRHAESTRAASSASLDRNRPLGGRGPGSPYHSVGCVWGRDVAAWTDGNGKHDGGVLGVWFGFCCFRLVFWLPPAQTMMQKMMKKMWKTTSGWTSRSWPWTTMTRLSGGNHLGRHGQEHQILSTSLTKTMT